MNWRRWPSPTTMTVAADERDSDARPAEDHPRRMTVDPEAGRRASIRRRAIALALVAAFVAGAGVALFGEGGYLDMRRLQTESERLRIENEARRERIEGLRIAIARLEHDASARERIAREELGLVRPGEIDFLLPPTPPGGSNRWRR